MGWGKKQTNRPVSGQFSEEKTGLENRFLVPEILNKYKRSIFLRRPVACLEVARLARLAQLARLASLVRIARLAQLG